MKRAFAAALLAIACSLPGCRQVLDVDDFGTKPTYLGRTDGYAYASELCRDCVDEHCDAPAEACGADPGCDAQARCLALCRITDHACRGRCSVSTPSTSTMAALVACQAEHCGSSMPEADRCGASRAVHGNSECDRCRAESSRCLLALERLSKNASAVEHERCRDVCTCRGDCPGGGPGCECPADEEAMSRVTAVADCCSSACARSVPDWSCLGSVQSPSPEAGSLEVHLGVTVPYSTTPIPGVRVQACSELPTCDRAALETTDTDGWATITIPKPLMGDHFGHLRLTWEEPDNAPALFYFFPPVRETPIWVVRRIVSRSLADGVLSMYVPDVHPDWEHKGGIVFSARSCNNAPAPGLRIVPNSNLDVIYFTGQNVDPSATETSSEGTGFIANAEPGRHVLEARRGGELVGKYSVSVVAGSLTHLVVEPTPLHTAP